MNEDITLVAGLEGRNVTLKQKEDENKLSFKKKYQSQEDLTNEVTTMMSQGNNRLAS